MGLTRNCIVISNGKFEAVSFDQSGEVPLNQILFEPTGQTYNNQYLCIESGVSFSWTDNSFTGVNGMFEVKYKKNVMLSTQKPKIPVVLDALNKYKGMSEEELNKLLEEKQEEEKSALELEIEKLKDRKKELQGDLKVYIQIEMKRKELNELIQKLEN